MKRKYQYWFAPLCLAAAPFFQAEVQAENKPLWEAGIGIAAVSFPHYRGSDQQREYVLPAPYFVYRGDILKVSEQSVRGLLMKSERAEIDISINGSPPVDSHDNHARRGMPDLPATVELGPSLQLTLAKSETGDKKLDLRLPLRPVFSATGGVHYVGTLFQPQLNLDWRNVGGWSGWNMGILGGPIFSDRRYNRFFYNVDPAYATPTRPAYQTGGGYAGAQFIVALSKRFPSYWVGAFAKADTVSGAVFDDSPLVRRRANFSAGFAISWILGASDTLVDRRE
ncbi:MAG: MipA/OmpV family protein [Azonexus sp.]|nr:MipA/OmpV family protein [Azonexus sp.]